jgi:hypothetical protein
MTAMVTGKIFIARTRRGQGMRNKILKQQFPFHKTKNQKI